MIVLEKILQNSTSSVLEDLLPKIEKDIKSESNSYACAILNLSLFELLEDDKYLSQCIEQFQNIISDSHANKYTSNVPRSHIAFLGQILVEKGFYHNIEKSREIDFELFENTLAQIKLLRTDSYINFSNVLNYFSQNPQNQLHVFFVEELINQLFQVVKKDELGSRIVQSDCVDLSFPYGMSGLLITLIKTYFYFSEDRKIKGIIDDGVKYILNYKIDVDFSEKSYDFFPNHILGGGEKPIFSNQMSLSSGDLSKAFLFYQYSKISDNANILRLANFVGLNTLIRKAQHQHNVINSSFSNGSSGIAFMYHKMYQFSNIEAYKQGKVFWVEKTLEFLNNEKPSDYSQKFDIWEGKLGVNLALLSCLTPKKLSWESIYGLSI